MDYKEKLEEAKKLYKTANADQKYVLELLFPEIKENEEERIRKTLIEYFNAYPKDYFGGLKKSYIVAWLEKQDEKNKIEALLTEYEKGRADTIAEMNSTWGEEDEKIYSRIYDIIHAAAFSNYDVDEDGNELGEYAKIISWFKALKDRVQAKYKLNEKDIDLIRYIGNAVTCEDAAKYLKSKGIEVIDVHAWLESIKYIVQSQNTWQPSEE